MGQEQIMGSVVAESSLEYSAVIPTIGRTETLNTVITSLVMQTIPPAEIIVLDEAKTPVCESFAVNQALDVASLSGIDVCIIRNRNRKGIGPARLHLARKARCQKVLMVDDDVVLYPDCVEHLMDDEHVPEDVPWVVPTCILVPAALEADGYMDTAVSPNDPSVLRWTDKYEWFIPYFIYEEPVRCSLRVSGTQAILLDREALLSNAACIEAMGNLPREDTVMTRKMGKGYFNSQARCLHYEHPSQTDRGNWGSSMFYRIHEAILNDPDGFVQIMKK